MNRRLVATVALGAGVLLILAGGGLYRHASVNHSRASSRQVKDQTARLVSIPERPQHIVSLCSTATDSLIRLGEAGRLCAVDEFNRNIPGLGAVPCISKGSALSREQVLALHADMAFVWWFQDDAAHLLEEMSVPVVRLRTGRATELSESISLVGQCVNREADSARLALSLKDWIAGNAPTSGGHRPRVYIELYGPLKTIGKDSYTNDVLEMAGAENIAAGQSGRVLFSVEGLTQADPDVVLVVGDASALEAAIQRPEMARLRAVRGQRAFAVPHAWLIPGAGFPVAVVRIRAILHTDASKE